MSKRYAGIGARLAPADMLALAEMVAERLDERGWTLRSGHAPGMDQAFETGAGCNAEVYLPWPSFEHSESLEADVIVDRPTSAAYNIAARFHPAWDRASKGARALHARNVHQVLGRDCDMPSGFVLCWTLNGEVRGGTGQAIRVAREYGVPIYNLADPNVLRRVEGLLELDWSEA
jgi:hypothetical protein